MPGYLAAGLFAKYCLSGTYRVILGKHIFLITIEMSSIRREILDIPPSKPTIEWSELAVHHDVVVGSLHTSPYWH